MTHGERERGLLDLMISRLPGLYPRDRLRLCAGLRSEGDLARLSKRDAGEILMRPLKRFWDIDDVRFTAEQDEKTCRARQAGWVSYMEGGYPPLLREIYDPPAVVFFRGRLPDPEKRLLGMVGTRRPSAQAASQAYGLARDLGRRGVSVVSGLALGTDAICHRGNIDGGAPTYAVLGSGVDEVYPRSNRPLAKRVLDSGGAVLSEYPCGTPPRKWHFPARNRIISALSSGLFIAEAPEKSGALITADFALEQGKDVFVSSAGARQEKNPARDRRGTIKLAYDGAQVIYCSRSLLERLGFDCPGGENGGSFSAGEALARGVAAALNIELSGCKEK